VIIYVLWVWLLATLFFLAIEMVCLSFLPVPQEFLAELLQAQPDLSHQLGLHLSQYPLAMHLFVWGGLGLILLVLGYVFEWKLHPIQSLYLRLQRIYPPWYRRWPASWREIYLVLILGGGGLGLLFLLAQISHLPGLNTAYICVGWSALWAGLSIRPILRYRTLQNQDRPEKPPQAFIHNIAPAFPLRHSLLIGQVYLRLFLPLFCLFVLLIPILGMGQSHLSTVRYLLLFGCLLAGLGLAWALLKESSFDTQLFRDNLFQLGARLSFAGSFLLFGVNSDNPFVLILFALFAGIFAGSY
jgi:hypothetical protein